MPRSFGLDVIFEDNHLLVVCKAAGLVTQGAAPGQTSVIDLARQYLKQKYHKPGNVYLGIVSRLDAPATGVLVLARTSKAASRLAEQFRTGRVAKTYWAAVFEINGKQPEFTTFSTTLGEALMTMEYDTMVKLTIVAGSKPGTFTLEDFEIVDDEEEGVSK